MSLTALWRGVSLGVLCVLVSMLHFAETQRQVCGARCDASKPSVPASWPCVPGLQVDYLARYMRGWRIRRHRLFRGEEVHELHPLPFGGLQVRAAQGDADATEVLTKAAGSAAVQAAHIAFLRAWEGAHCTAGGHLAVPSGSAHDSLGCKPTCRTLLGLFACTTIMPAGCGRG